MRPVPFVLSAILGFAGCAAAPPVGAESVAAEVPVAGPPLVRSAFAGSPALDAARADRDAADDLIMQVRETKSRDDVGILARNAAVRSKMARWRETRPELFEEVDAAFKARNA